MDIPVRPDGHEWVPKSLANDGRRWRAAKPQKSATFERDPDDHRARLCGDNARWVHDQLRRYRYKPNVSWEVLATPTREARRIGPSIFDYEVQVWFSAWVLDSRGSDRIMPVSTVTRVPESATLGRDEEYLRMWLMHTLRELEYHELREWLRCDGALIDDPHARDRSGIPSKIGPID